MNAEDKFSYWLDIAQYDMDTADAMFKSGRWLYVVFMCQQAVAKLCKGLYLLYIDDNIPRIHDISTVVNRFADKLSNPVSEDTFKFFERLTNFYIQGRYPKYLQQLSAAVNETEAKNILDKSKEVFTWLLTLKPPTKPSTN